MEAFKFRKNTLTNLKEKKRWKKVDKDLIFKYLNFLNATN